MRNQPQGYDYLSPIFKNPQKWQEHSHFIFRIQVIIMETIPSKHETLTQCWSDIGPASQTVDNIQENIVPTTRACSDMTK